MWSTHKNKNAHLYEHTFNVDTNRTHIQKIFKLVQTLLLL
jgi:hypothetical protein